MTIPRQFLLFRDLFLWTKINWKHYWRAIQVPSDHRVVSRAASNVWRGENWKYTVFCYRVITVNFSEADMGELSRSGSWWYQRVWAAGDGEVMTGHFGWERGERKPMVMMIWWSVSSEDECWGVTSSLVKIVRTQTEKRQSLVSLIHCWVLTCFLCIIRFIGDDTKLWVSLT